MVVIKSATAPKAKKLRWDSELITDKIERWINTPEEIWQPQYDESIVEIVKTIKDSIDYYENYVFPNKAEIIKQKYLNGVDRALIMKDLWLETSTNRVYPLVWPIHDTFLSNLHEIETTPRVVARNQDDQGKAEVWQDWFDWAKEVSEYESNMKVIRSEASLIWTSYARSWYISEEVKIEWNEKWEAKSVKRDDSRPTLEHVSFFQLFYDPFQPSFYRLPWKTYRYISNLSSVENKYSFLFSDDAKGKSFKSFIPAIKSGTPLSDKDYTRIYSAKNYEKELLSGGLNGYEAWINSKLFQVNYTDQNLVEVIEYWYDDKFILIVNGVSVYNWLSPYPFNSDPFLIVVHEEVPNCIHGVWIGDKLINHQHQANTIFSWLEDIMRKNMYPMYKAPKNALRDAAWQPIQYIPYEPNRVIEDSSSLGNSNIEPIKYVDSNFVSVFMKRLQDIVLESYEIVWLNSYTQWGNGKMERSAQWVTQKVAIIKTRLLSIIESLNRFNSKLFIHWIAIWVVKFPQTFSFRIIKEDGKTAWQDINLADVLNKFDIVAESEAMRLATKEMKASQSLNAVNQLTAINIDPITQLPIYNMEELISNVMEKFDFETPAKYTEQEIMEKLALVQRLRPQEPAQPTPTDMPASIPSPDVSMPEDAWMLGSVMTTAN